jgi:hypothetical protein
VDDTKVKRYSRDALATELAYRRDRRHSIFSWCSSIFVAIIGGSAVLIQEGKKFTRFQEWLISFTIIVLAGFTVFWISHHWNIEYENQVGIGRLETDLHMTTIEKKENIGPIGHKFLR